MKFTYQYRTSDNAVHVGEVSASSRDAAYAVLKGQGIKPYGIAEASGLFNRVLGKGKRWITIGVLAAAVIALGYRVCVSRQSDLALRVSERHQIYGDPAFLAECEDRVFANVFEDVGDRILAVYAQPGGAEGLGSRVAGATSADLEASATRDVAFVNGERREVGELKAIVAGMKVELKAYLADGIGTVDSYLQRLEERRREELAIYAKVVAELANEKDETIRESKNEALRAIGLRTVPRPKNNKIWAETSVEKK